MKRKRNAVHSSAELDQLYKRSESWVDIGDAIAAGSNVEFVKENLRIFYALPAQTARAVDKLARRRRTTPERLIEKWVKEKLAEAG